MKVNKLGNKYKNIRRYREIWRVLRKYGFSFITDKMSVGSYLDNLFFRESKRLSQEYTPGQRIRMAIEELGPTFIKLGQILSTRYDLLPQDIVKELSNLQDKVKEFDFSIAKPILTQELGLEINDIFAEFDEKPIAAASIGQVYRGKLHSGETVVVKIQRPRVKEIIERDVEILKEIATLLDDHINKTGPIKYVDIVNEFSFFIKREIDYTYEAQNCQRFRENFVKDDKIIIPKVYWTYTTKRVLVLEEIKGFKVNDLGNIECRQWDKRLLAQLGAKTFLKQVFVHKFYHGDPHPGNIIIAEKDKIGFIDFGIVGFIDNTTLDFINKIIKAGYDRNIEGIIEALYKVNAIPPEIDELNLTKELYFIINYYYNVPISKLRFEEALNEVLQVSYKYRLRIPSQLVLLIKAVITLEGTAKKLSSDFSFGDIYKDIIKDMAKDKINIKSLIYDFASDSHGNIGRIKEMPKQLSSILDKLDKNQLRVFIKQEGVKQLEREINTMTNKISLSLLVASLIVGSSIVIKTDTNPSIMGVSAIGLVGYIIGAILGIYIIFSTLLNIKRNK